MIRQILAIFALILAMMISTTAWSSPFKMHRTFTTQKPCGPTCKHYQGYYHSANTDKNPIKVGVLFNNQVNRHKVKPLVEKATGQHCDLIDNLRHGKEYQYQCHG